MIFKKIILFLIAFLLGTGDITFSKEESNATFSYTDYATVLKRYVDDKGLVNYEELKLDRGSLDTFTESIGKLSRRSYLNWDEQKKIAFWINAYNAFTLVTIINNYPIKSSFFSSFYYPKNSIRQIKGVFDGIQFRVMGEDMTLDEIEHDQLRRNFNEPRIHMALVCAAISCPPLRNEPYSGERLDMQLDDQSLRFLSDQRKFRIDMKKNKVYLSRIFKWFGDDFIKKYTQFKKHSALTISERAVLEFISKYVNEESKNYLYNQTYTVEYEEYDWSLNEQKRKNK